MGTPYWFNGIESSWVEPEKYLVAAFDSLSDNEDEEDVDYDDAGLPSDLDEDEDESFGSEEGF